MGIIGNCCYSALVDRRANVKWMCWPRFDSSFIFGSLLDEQVGGNFSIAPADPAALGSQSYLQNTNVLVTEFRQAEGVFQVIDFAPRFDLFERVHRPTMLFRKVKWISGNPLVKVVCTPSGEYGQTKATTFQGSNHLRYEGLKEPVRLTTDAPITFVREGKSFVLSHDLYFVLSWGIPLEGPLESTVEDFLRRTVQYWRGWIERSSLPKRYQQEVIRSALALKLHQFEDTGGVIASCTTSLPEIPGETRNWDYRFCWLRDAYYTLSALNSLGHFEEVEKYARFLENLRAESAEHLQPVYRIDCDSDLTEITLPLEGYLGNKPVRVGNGAAQQTQHDVYGQCLLSLFHLYTDARLVERDRRVSKRELEVLLSFMDRTAVQPDNGIWEFRGQKLAHAYTSLFQWAGAAACMKIARSMADEPLRLRAEKIKVRSEEHLESCYNPEREAYAQHTGSAEMDASLLQMISLGYFCDKPKERALKHLQAIRRELELSPGFLLRYKKTDDFGQQKSAFLICSFWLIEAMANLGLVDEADALFRKVINAGNPLGLISEDYDPATHSQWGNFPQTYSHVGLINAAFALDRAQVKPFFL